MAGLVRITLNDGTELEVEAGQPWTAREQIAWEEQFKTSFQAVYVAIAAEAKAYLEAFLAAKADAAPDDLPADFEPDVDVREFKVSWWLWFAWYRLRPRVASRFETFINDQVAGYRFIQEPKAPVEESGLDPTQTAERSAPAP